MLPRLEVSCVPQGLKHRTILFNLFINYMTNGTEDTFSKFADGTEVTGEGDILNDCTVIQIALDRLENWCTAS